MSVSFMDNTDVTAGEGTVDIDRLYRLDWKHFGDVQWKALADIYRELPGYMGDNHELPYWFGTDEEQGPVLWASVEPPGLQIAGKLSGQQFQKWHEMFTAGISNLPSYEVR